MNPKKIVRISLVRSVMRNPPCWMNLYLFQAQPPRHTFNCIVITQLKHFFFVESLRFICIHLIVELRCLMTLEEILRLHAAVFNHKEMETHFSLLLSLMWKALRARERDYYFHTKCYLISKDIRFLEERDRECVNISLLFLSRSVNISWYLCIWVILSNGCLLQFEWVHFCTFSYILPNK